MDFALTENQEAIRDSIAKICGNFPDAYWLKKDREGGFPHDFHKALADAGWLGICVPEAYGGSGLGITEAAIMIAHDRRIGCRHVGASAVHINVFGLNPVVVFGSEEQRADAAADGRGARKGRASLSPSRTPVSIPRS